MQGDGGLTNVRNGSFAAGPLKGQSCHTRQRSSSDADKRLYEGIPQCVRSVSQLHDNGAFHSINDHEIRRFSISEQQLIPSQKYSLRVMMGAPYVVSLAACSPNPPTVFIDGDIRVLEGAAIHDVAATIGAVDHNLVAVPDALGASTITTAVVIEVTPNSQ